MWVVLGSAECGCPLVLAAVENRQLYLNYFIVWAETVAMNATTESRTDLRALSTLLLSLPQSDGNRSRSRSQSSRLVPNPSLVQMAGREQRTFLYNPASELERHGLNDPLCPEQRSNDP